MPNLWLLPLIFLLLAGCQHSESTHDHNADHQHEGASDHDHDEAEAIQITLWDEDVELFIEHQPFVAGTPGDLVAHVTHLKGWRPRTSGEIQVVLSKSGQTPIVIRDPAPIRDGIYIPKLEFPEDGIWTLEIRVPFEEKTSVQKIYGTLVYESSEAAAQDAAPSASEDDPGVSFLKEQQWRMDFASVETVAREFRDSLQANGVIAPRAGGETVIQAPVGGRLLSAPSVFPHIGVRVEAGQLLGSLVPRLDQSDDPAAFTLAVQRAELAHEYALKELNRLQKLYDEEAIPQSRLYKAELDADTARADLQTARERLRQFTAAQRETDGDDQGRATFHAPISGTIIEANFTPGALVEAGEILVHIIDLDEVWLETRIPESDLGRISQANGAWFAAEGLDRIFQVGPENGGRVVALGGRIDPHNRTAPLIFELPNPDGALKIGMFARVGVFTGKTASGPAAPVEAVLEEAGQSIVYVQTGGETFERRMVRLGIRDGEWVQIVSGIDVGERVVSKGAYQVRLAGASSALPAHGHQH